MSSSLYSTFQAARQASKEQNWKLVTTLLGSLDRQTLMPAARELYDGLWEIVPVQEKSREPVAPWAGGRLSDLDSNDILPGCSIVSCCMNRNDNLNRAITSWLQTDVDEIVVVDWSSRLPVSRTLDWVKDDRLKIIRVDGEEKWILTAAFNVGLRLASYSRVYKLDADIVVSPRFTKDNGFSTGQFVRGHWRDALDSGLHDQVYVNGSFGAFKSDLRQVGYYNELIRTYGWDDSDLYERLSSHLGLGWKSLALSSISHMEQDQEDRTRNQDVKPHSFLDAVLPTDFQNRRNQFIGRNTDYWTLNRLQDYEVALEGENYWSARRLTNYISSPHYFLQDANDYAALSYIWQKQATLLHGSSNPKLLARFIHLEHEGDVEFTETQAVLGLAETPGKTVVLPRSRASLKSQLTKLAAQVDDDEVSCRVLVLSDGYWRQQAFIDGVELNLIGLDKDLLTQVLLRRKAARCTDPEVSTAREVDQADLAKALKEYPVTSGRRRIYIDAQHGLGNRLRAIASAAVLAEATDRDLVVIWEPDHHCDCEISELFDYDGPVLKRAFPQACQARNIDFFNYMEAETGAKKNALIEVREHDVYVRSAFVLTTAVSDWSKENDFLRKLTPVKQVRDLVKPFKLKKHVAVHVRMEGGAGLDTHAYETPENWTEADHEQLHYWREKSNFKHFIKRLDALIKEEPDIRIFLATDRQETYDIFKKTFGDRLSFLERRVYDRSREQLIYALADAILLSRCNRLLGSTWSSFTEIARRLTPGYSSIEMSGEDF
ncbi:glycosyltransferase [Rhodovibrionaceae bacterium A322]